CPTPIAAISTSPLAKEGQHEKGVAAPSRRGLDLATAREPALGFFLSALLDGERGQSVVAREQELRLADLLGDLERLPVARGALVPGAAALVDLPENDERDRQVIALTEPPVELHRGFRRAHAPVVVAGQRAVAARERAVEPGLLQLVADSLGQRQSLAAVFD